MRHNIDKSYLIPVLEDFSDITDIKDALASYAAQSSTTILQHKNGVALAALRTQYLELAGQGQRPILLAVGGAWTGFDLHHPNNPNALTDLVILNAPFGAISKTFARQERLSRTGGFVELVALMVTLVRQGIGRLVRSPDTPHNRKIHWLDARIHDSNLGSWFLPLRRFFSKYKTINV